VKFKSSIIVSALFLCATLGTPIKGPSATYAPAVTLTPSTLTFTCYHYYGNCGTSASGLVTLKNSGNAVLRITSIVISGYLFSGSSTCGTSLGAGLSCPIYAHWKPTFGAHTGTVKVTDNATNSPQTVQLVGYYR
jgi:hypothetical protein